MTLEVDKAIEQQDIIDRFNTRIRDWVGTHVTINPDRVFSGSAYVWSGEAANQRRGSTAHLTQLIYFSNRASNIAATSANHVDPWGTPRPGSPNTWLKYNGEKPDAQMSIEDFSADVGAKDNVGHVVKVIKNFLRDYSRIHRARFQNYGNVGPSYYDGVIHCNNLSNAAADQMDADIDVAKDQEGVKSGAPLDPDSLINLIERCRTIWVNRCLNGGIRSTYNFSFCHNSCHSNVTCYNSRGRR